MNRSGRTVLRADYDGAGDRRAGVVDLTTERIMVIASVLLRTDDEMDGRLGSVMLDDSAGSSEGGLGLVESYYAG